MQQLYLSLLLPISNKKNRHWPSLHLPNAVSGIAVVNNERARLQVQRASCDTRMMSRSSEKIALRLTANPYNNNNKSQNVYFVEFVIKAVSTKMSHWFTKSNVYTHYITTLLCWKMSCLNCQIFWGNSILACRNIYSYKYAFHVSFHELKTCNTCVLYM